MWAQIRSNKIRSVILVAALAGVLLILGYFFGEAFLGSGLFGLIIALVIWGINRTRQGTGSGQVFIRPAKRSVNEIGAALNHLAAACAGKVRTADDHAFFVQHCLDVAGLN